MAVKKSNIVGIALLLALTVTSVSESFANAENNNLVQLDLKRASNNSVNVTLFTSNTYNDNVLVRKKSDNKYVILIPKIQSNGFSSSSLNGVNDLVSNIDVKTVNDTSGGYTKVTLITTKPLDIKTSTQKSAPVTAEQNEYKTLIAQANAIKNNIAKQELSKKSQQQPKTEVTVNRASVAVKPASKQVSATEKTPVNTKKSEPVKQISKHETQKKEVQKPQIKLTEVNPPDNRQTRKEQLAELIREVKQEKQAETAPKETISKVQTIAGTTFNAPVKDIKELAPIVKQTSPSYLSVLKNKIGKIQLPHSVRFGLLPLLALIIIFNILKPKRTNTNKESTVRQPIMNTIKYNNIVNNSELSWQQKYQRYLDESAKPVARANNKGHYTFIKTPAEEIQNTVIEEKRHELEKMISDIAPEIKENVKPEIIEVHNEEDAIQKTIKFKAFDTHKTSLNITNRDKIKSRFKKYETEIPLREQQNVELGNSMLHSNTRRLKDANLDIADVENRGGRMKFKPTEYIMSSIDEFFSIMDKEKTAPATQPSAAHKEKISNPMQQTNPITKLRNETKSSYINGLIVKSGFNIDENKGFYIVNLDGKSALIGKVNDEVFVLKTFDTNITNPIQVRHDNANVYMVKAGGFKSLVEVNENKMGVLIEL